MKANTLVWKCQNSQLCYLNNWVNSDLSLALLRQDLALPWSHLWIIITLFIKQFQSPTVLSIFQGTFLLAQLFFLSLCFCLSDNTPHNIVREGKNNSNPLTKTKKRNSSDPLPSGEPLYQVKKKAMFVFVFPPLKKLVCGKWTRDCPRRGWNATFGRKVVGSGSLSPLSGLPSSLWFAASILIQRQILQANFVFLLAWKLPWGSNRLKPFFYLLQLGLWPQWKWTDTTTHLLYHYLLTMWKPFPRSEDGAGQWKRDIGHSEDGAPSRAEAFCFADINTCGGG